MAMTTTITNSPSILTCSNTTQLSEFVSHMVPKIWTGTPFFMTTDRSNCFRIFCQNIIKSTQISSSCILVALFYIYRLRFSYPSISASVGSEVRLFTTALVLANKFLDDNTFTNKTWSEVSSVPLHELNIMEMEFLSALQYRTVVHHVQFFSWTFQCQHWMSQLMLTLRPQVLIPRGKRSAHHFILSSPSNVKKSRLSIIYPPHINPPILSYYQHHPAAAAVATVAAATAMNVNYLNFIPRA